MISRIHPYKVCNAIRVRIGEDMCPFKRDAMVHLQFVSRREAPRHILPDLSCAREPWEGQSSWRLRFLHPLRRQATCFHP